MDAITRLNLPPEKLWSIINSVNTVEGVKTALECVKVNRLISDRIREEMTDSLIFQMNDIQKVS